MKDDDDDFDPYEDHIGPYSGHTPWEPGVGCLISIVMAFILLAVVISIGAGK